MFGDSKQSKEDLNPLLFLRVGEILVEVGKRFQSFTEAGKPLQSALPNRGSSYSTSDSPSLAKPVTAYPSVPRLVVSGGVYEGAGCRKARPSSSVLGLLVFLGFLSWIKQLGFKPGDPQLFEELIQVFSLAMVVVSQPLVSPFFLFLA